MFQNSTAAPRPTRTLRLKLPLLWCSDCRTQVGVQPTYVIEGTDTLICCFCVDLRRGAGSAAVHSPDRAHVAPTSDTYRALRPEWAETWAPALDDRSSAELLIRLGAEAVGTYINDVTGEPADPADMLRAEGLSQ